MSLLTEQEIVSIAERCGLLTFVSDAGYENDALWFDADCTDFARAIESTVIEKIKAQGESVSQFQGRDGAWHGFIDTHHYENTVADGSWPIRTMYRLPEGD